MLWFLRDQLWCKAVISAYWHLILSRDQRSRKMTRKQTLIHKIYCKAINFRGWHGLTTIAKLNILRKMFEIQISFRSVWWARLHGRHIRAHLQSRKKVIEQSRKIAAKFQIRREWGNLEVSIRTVQCIAFTGTWAWKIEWRQLTNWCTHIVEFHNLWAYLHAVSTQASVNNANSHL